MKHKWEKEIKAWADGAEIESKLDNEYGQWFLCCTPIWNDENFIHRIKPQPKEPQYLYVYNINGEIKFCEPCGIIQVPNVKQSIVKIGKIKVEQDDE